MRITTFLIIVALLQVSAKTSAQLISLSGKGMALVEVLKEIRHQSGYDFVFSASTLEQAHPISVDLQNIPLEDALRQVFENQPVSYEITDGAVTLWTKATNRPIHHRHPERHEVESNGSPLILALETVSGRIVDSLGRGLDGASIRVLNAEGKRTTLQTKTNHEGYFTLHNVPEEAILEISYVGFLKQTLSANVQMGSIVIKAEESALEEVVVNTGYQSLPKERATGSFVHIDNGLFNQQVSTNVLERLEAVTSGLMVDRNRVSNNGIRIRGLSTINGPKDALIIVDNFPYNGDIENINPNDVENITILRDAAAASIWGARAGNGVIVITTKKGNANIPLVVESNNVVTIGAVPNLQNIPGHMNSMDFIDIEEMLYDNGYYNSRFAPTSFAVLSPVVERLRERETASAERGLAIDREIDFYRNYDVRDDYLKYMYQRSVNQQYHLGMRGGNQKIAWATAAGFDNNVSVLDVKERRVNLRFHQQYQPFDQLKLVSEITYTRRGSQSGKPGYGHIQTSGNFILPYTPLADEHGNTIAFGKDFRTPYLDTVGNGRLLDWRYYPMEDYKHDVSNQETQGLVLNTGVNYRIFQGVMIDLKYSYESQHQLNENLATEQSYATRNIINRFTQLNPNGSVTFVIPKGSTLTHNSQALQAHNARGQINFSHDWADHQLIGLVGGEVRTANILGKQFKYWGYNEHIMTIGSVDDINLYTVLPNGTRGRVTNTDRISETTHNNISGFANASYTYKSRYAMSGSLRTDASNLFGLKTNDQWNPFWSAGISWNLSEESFYRFPTLPYLKLRATYGYSGNVNPAMVAVTTMRYATGNLPTTLAPYASFRSYNNPALRWETSKMINLATDFQSINNRISGTVEYFQKNGVNLFGLSQLDYTAGIGSSITKNVASMKSKGLDITLNTINFDNVLKWSSVVNFSYAKETVTEWFVNNLQGRNFLTGYNNTGTITGMPGKPIHAIYGYRWAGLDPENGNPLGYFDGAITDDYLKLTGSETLVSDLRYFGSGVPTTYGSFLNSFSYKGFSLNMSMIFKLGYFVRRPSLSYSALYTAWNGHAEYRDRWQQPGDENHTNVPALVYPANNNRDLFYQHSEATVIKGDHIRFQYLNLAYSIPTQFITRWNIDAIQVFVNASNLGVLWRANDLSIDPDYISSLYATDSPRNISIGVKLKF